MALVIRISRLVVALVAMLAVALPCPCGDHGASEDEAAVSGCCSGGFSDELAAAEEPQPEVPHDEDECPHCQDTDMLGMSKADDGKAESLSQPSARVVFFVAAVVRALEGERDDAELLTPSSGAPPPNGADLHLRHGVIRC